jgi:hypothetical protein
LVYTYLTKLQGEPPACSSIENSLVREEKEKVDEDGSTDELEDQEVQITNKCW